VDYSRYIRCILLLALRAGLLIPRAVQAQAQSASFPVSTTSALDDPLVQQWGEDGLDLLYTMKSAEARALFDRIEERYPGHPIGPFLNGLIVWWEIMPDLNDERHDDAFYDAMDEVIKRCDRILDRNSENFDAIFFKGAALGFRGRLRSNRGVWFKAAMDGRGALKYVFHIAERDTSNADYVFGVGVSHYFADVVPEKYPVVRPFMSFFPDGNRDEGLRELHRVADEGRFIQTEAIYFLLQIYMIYETDYAESLKYARMLRERHPANPYFHVMEGRVYAQWGRWKQALPIFDEVLARYQEGQAGYTPAMAEYALYYRARSQMVFREYGEAITSLIQLEALVSRRREDTYFKVLGRLRQGMCYDALGQRKVAVARYREVLKMEDFSGAHDRANRYLKQPFG
jgi:tetratricopeptide (TPR) repeat protein